MGEMRTIRLPEDLCAEAEKRWGTRFGSIDELLVFLLQEIQRDEGMQLDQVEEHAVEQRLRDLGYI